MIHIYHFTYTYISYTFRHLFLICRGSSTPHAHPLSCRWVRNRQFWDRFAAEKGTFVHAQVYLLYTCWWVYFHTDWSLCARMRLFWKRELVSFHADWPLRTWRLLFWDRFLSQNRKQIFPAANRDRFAAGRLLFWDRFAAGKKVL